MFNLSEFIKLLRPQQYYKNFLIFLGLIFSASVFNYNLYLQVFIGFFALSAISSISYIINDWKDIQSDKAHPEKKFRPLASGKVSIFEALLLIVLLFVIIMILILLLPIENKNKLLFSIIILAIFITSQFYSLYFKNKAFYDVIFIALNYIWRALAGVVVIAVTLSPWLFILGFLFAMFLALSKRKGDLFLLKENASKHKKVFEVYTVNLLDQLIVLISGAMIVAYSIYIVESVIDFNRDLTDFSKFQNPYLMLLTLPSVTLIVMRLLYLQISGSEKIRKAELLFLDKEIILNGIFLMILVILALYWNNFGIDLIINSIYS